MFSSNSGTSRTCVKATADGVEFMSMLRTGTVELCERLTSVVRSRSVAVLLSRVGLFGSGGKEGLV